MFKNVFHIPNEIDGTNKLPKVDEHQTKYVSKLFVDLPKYAPFNFTADLKYTSP